MNTQSSCLTGIALVRWLSNKLGDVSGERWSGKRASTILSREILNELPNCFQALEPQVKLKIIIAIPHLSVKMAQMWRTQLLNLLDVAKEDADSWVRTVAKVYSSYPNAGAIKSDITDDEQFAQTISEFQQILDNVVPSINSIIPPASLIASAATNQLDYGYGASKSDRHFTLRKQSKSDRMLQDALRAVNTTASPGHRKAAAPRISAAAPLRMRGNLRKSENALPMRGIPTAPAAKISAGFTNEPRKFQRTLPTRAGGAMLLDISDIPQPAIVKKRRGGGATTSATSASAAKADVKPAGEKPPPKRARKPKAKQSAAANAGEEAAPSDAAAETSAPQLPASLAARPSMQAEADALEPLARPVPLPIVTTPFGGSQGATSHFDPAPSYGTFTFI